MYQLPFYTGQKLIEIGGGANPVIRPNLDMRQCNDANGNSTVDIVADITKPLPLNNSEYDGVFCQYCLEHCSWRRIKDFLAEIYRILKPGGIVVFITPNTESQMRHLLETEDWDDCSSMLFGGQVYPGDDWRADAHYSFISPFHTGKLLREVGFGTIMTMPHGAKNTDLIIEAKKDVMDRRKVFDKHYFHGGKDGGGYPEGYRDVHHNWAIANRLMKLAPQSVLELGAGRGYVLKKLQDEGIKVKGLEISHHCYLTRAINDIVKWDICQLPWPVADKSFDLCYSQNVFAFIPEELLPGVLKEMDRVSCRGFHGIGFDSKDVDKTKVTVHDKDWWVARMPVNHQVIDSKDLEDSVLNCVPVGDLKLKVNVGSFTNMFYHGWVNIDILDLRGFADVNGYKFFQKDVREGLPFDENSVDLMYSSHVIEHLTYDEGKKLLRECRRVMKQGAVLRLMMPDTESLTALYFHGQLDCFNEINDGSEVAPSQAGKLWALLFAGHQAAYDYRTVEIMGKEIGFEVKRRSFMEGQEQIIKETMDMLPELSLFVELTKV